MKKVIQQVLSKVLESQIKGNIFIAYSGGLDSAVLLHSICSNIMHFPERKIVAVHVDHGLQDVSSLWAEQCERVAAGYGIDFRLIQLEMNKNPGESIELAARNARYKEFEKILNTGDVMLFAHHADDQVETFLQQALRGAGVQGLSGIPESRPLGKGCLLRPLLDVSRSELEEYAQANELKWVEDPTNHKSDFDRNLLRNEIIPQLEKRWPGAKKGILRSLSHCREASKQIDDESTELLTDIAQQNQLIVAKLSELDFVQQKNVIRLWIRNNNIVLPNTERLESGIKSLIGAAVDKNPILDWDYGIIRRYQGLLYLEKMQQHIAREELSWDLCSAIKIDNETALEPKCISGVGLSKEYASRADITIKYRKGGERCRPFGREGSHELKKLFQEYKIPPWMRDKIPLIYIGGEIAVVVGCCYCKPFALKGDGVITIAMTAI